jgi:MFS transporter, DHA1 family, tetracycline resistance protein
MQRPNRCLQVYRNFCPSKAGLVHEETCDQEAKCIELCRTTNFLRSEDGVAHSASAQVAQPAQTVAVIPTGNLRRWIEPWYIAYAILGALASGAAVILIPLIVTGGGGSATQIGTAIAAQNIGALFAPFWGWISDRSKSYRSIFFGGFILMAAGFLSFALFRGPDVWLASAFLIGFGTGASNTVASLFVVEFTPASEWGERISWLQTFNALGSVLGMAAAGFLHPELGMMLSALLVIPAILVGGWGLPVPGGAFHVPHVRATRLELANFVRRIEPLTASVTTRLHTFHLGDLKRLRTLLLTSFGIFLAGWFFFSLAISSFSSLYPVLMLKSFSMTAAKSSVLMSIATALSIPLYNLAGRLTSRRGPALILIVGMVVRMVALVGLGLVGIFHLPSTVLPALLPVIILFGSFQGIWPLLSVASNDLSAVLVHFSKGTAIGLFNAAAAIASAAGAIIGGVVADRFGYPSVGLFAALGIALALLFVLHLRRLERDESTAHVSAAGAES